MRWLFLMLGACTIQKSSSNITINGQNYCNNSSECAEGLLCYENHCLESQCFSSSDCLLEEFCNEAYQCISGCVQDSDCIAGDTCEDNTCVSYGCRDTELDCSVAEYCDESTGECYEDSFGHCDSCDFNSWQNGIPGGECVVLGYDENKYCAWDDFSQTGPGCDSNEVCLPSYLLDPFASGGFCATIYQLKLCSPGVEDTCPRGFECREDIYGNQTNVNDCVGDCDYYKENGYIH